MLFIGRINVQNAYLTKKDTCMESIRLLFSEVTVNDLENIHRLYSAPEVDKYNTLGIPKDIEDTKNLIRRMVGSQKATPRNSHNWTLTNKETNEFIGMAGLALSNNIFKLGEIYFEIMPHFWGNGYATEVANKLIIFGFDKFKLHKIEAGVATENVASIRVLEKVGMQREGMRRKLLPIRGEWKDSYHYAIVEDDSRSN